jgi:uncharacterized repeat protein (TIGR03803 family)
MRKYRAAAYVLACAAVMAGFSPVAQAASYKSLYSFKAGTDGANPNAAPASIGTTLYGTTYFGGGCGGNTLGCGAVFSWNTTTGAEAVAYAFTGASSGSFPSAGLVDVNGILYGVTSAGGATGKGAVFTVNPTSGAEKVVYSFRGGTDGAGPAASLVVVGSTLYGTTVRGGSKACNKTGCGTVFSFSTTAGTEKVVHAFQGGSDGASPSASLVSVGSALYGSTFYGGSGKCSGTISGCGTVFSINTSTNAEAVVYSFRGVSDGAGPYSNLVDVNGLLYGTTSLGGGSANCTGGCGTVFSLNPTSGAETVLYGFKATGDGQNPVGNLANIGSELYGTTTAGGAHSQGAVFAFALTSSAETVAYSFEGGTDGATPNGLVAIGSTLYGTTSGGGSSNCSGGCGTLFSFTP